MSLLNPMQNGPPNLKNALFFAVAILIPLAVIFIAAELVARRFDPELLTKEAVLHPFWTSHPTRHHTLKPGEYKDPLWGIYFRVNRLGFRGPEITKEKSPGAIRIFCIGDSVTMGPGLPDEAIYPRVLEKILLERYPGHRLEVINAGVSGYGIKEEYLQIKEDIFSLSPDAVVFQFCLNDLPGVQFADLINPNRDIAIPGKKFILENMALARFIRERYNRIGLKNTFFGLADLFEMDPESPKAKRIENSWEEYEKKISEIVSACRERQIRFMLIVVPHRAQFEDRQQRYIPQKRLLALGRKYGFDVLDLAPLFSSVNPLPYVYPDPVHPHPEGHKIIAQSILEWLEETSVITDH